MDAAIERICALEAKVKTLEADKGQKAGKVNKQKREPSEYNLFMKRALEEIKLSQPETPHKARFTEAVRRWNSRNE